MTHRAYTTFELALVCAILAMLVALMVIPQYDRYRRARQVDDAAAILVQDIAYLERFAQDSDPYEGATIEVERADPLRYTCFAGRPSGLDPQSHIRGALFVRSYDEVALDPGIVGRNTPLLFAHNGSVQYYSGGQWADQHAALTIALRSRAVADRSVQVDIDPFTGAAATQ